MDPTSSSGMSRVGRYFNQSIEKLTNSGTEAIDALKKLTKSDMETTNIEKKENITNENPIKNLAAATVIHNALVEQKPKELKSTLAKNLENEKLTSIFHLKSEISGGKEEIITHAKSLKKLDDNTPFMSLEERRSYNTAKGELANELMKLIQLEERVAKKMGSFNPPLDEDKNEAVQIFERLNEKLTNLEEWGKKDYKK